MVKKIFKVLLGIMLVPASFAFSVSLFEQITGIQSQRNPQNYFLYGVSFYIFLHLVFFKPVYLYVWGHEAMHVLATWLCGGKVSSFKVSSAGGSVDTSKSNFFIALAPYFFPTYTLFFTLILGCFSLFTNIEPYLRYFVFILGLTLSFHFIMTIEMIKKSQPDIIKTGYFFSINLIYLLNTVILAGILSFVFLDIKFLEFLIYAVAKTCDVYAGLFNQLFLC